MGSKLTNSDIDQKLIGTKYKRIGDYISIERDILLYLSNLKIKGN